MTDLIQRLRTPLTYGGPTEYFRYMREAADELERLVQDSEARESWIRVQDDEIERLTRERDEANANYDQCGQFIERQNETIDRLDVALGTSQQEVERLSAYADKLAAGLPEGMLPKDVEVMRDANASMAQEIERLTRERDEALNELHTCLLGGHVNELIAERDRLRAALEQIAASSAIKFGDTHASYRWTKLRDTARAALADKEDPLVAKYEEWQEGK
jgi:DNA repair exonuclease SbcCD ATPase subunit